MFCVGLQLLTHGSFRIPVNLSYCQIGTFHVSFTLGYILAFISEIVVTTVVRLGVFKIWEPSIFSLTPQVPSIILPWVLREKQYKPKRITLFAADFGASCIASPIIEEYLKLKVVQWTCKLPRLVYVLQYLKPCSRYPLYLTPLTIITLLHTDTETSSMARRSKKGKDAENRIRSSQ